MKTKKMRLKIEDVRSYDRVLVRGTYREVFASSGTRLLLLGGGSLSRKAGSHLTVRRPDFGIV